MYDFKTLSPPDFEEISGDLISARDSIRLYRYKPGRDRGIDLRHRHTDGGDTIVQSKHYLGTGFKGLYRDLKAKELPKIKLLNPKRYILTTSVALSPDEQEQLFELLVPYVPDLGDIVSQGDLNTLLRENPRIETRHAKLWFSSSTALQALLNRAVNVESADLIAQLPSELRTYVANPSLERALEVLNGPEGVVVISGDPGIGKSTLAKALISTLVHSPAEHQDSGTQHQLAVIRRATDANQCWGEIDEAQVFYYDDFLGQSTAAESFGRDDPAELVDLVQRIRRSDKKKLVLTTRNHVLSSALESNDYLKRAGLARSKAVVELTDYTRSIRAEILYNHLHFSEFPEQYFSPFVISGDYWSVIKHSNYSPRLIEDALRLAYEQVVSSDSFGSFLLKHLDDPKELWNLAFERNITDDARAVLFGLFALAGSTHLDALEHLTLLLSSPGRLAPTNLSFEHALRSLDGAFVRVTTTATGTARVSFANPSVNDFIAGRLSSRRSTIERLIASVDNFEHLTVFLSYLQHGDSGNALASLLRDLGSEVIAKALSVAYTPSLDRVGAPDSKPVEALLVERHAAMLRCAPEAVDVQALITLADEIAPRWATRRPLSAADVRVAGAMAALQSVETAVVEALGTLRQSIRVESLAFEEFVLAWELFNLPSFATDADKAHLRSAFKTFAGQVIRELQDPPSSYDELESMRYTLESLQELCELFEEDFDLDGLARHLRKFHDYLHPADDEYWPPPPGSTDLRDSEIDALFRGLESEGG
ncbi:MAG: hypothetical protein AAGD35_11430 [Actinomycetota bacterium]